MLCIQVVFPTGYGMKKVENVFLHTQGPNEIKVLICVVVSKGFAVCEKTQIN